MRLNELFVTEKISLTNLKNPLKREINDTMMDCIHQMYYNESKLDPKIKAHADSNSSLAEVNKFIKPLLTRQLATILAAGIEELLKGITETDVVVRFGDIHAEGQASGRVMTLSNKYINNMTDQITNTLYDSALDNITNENELVSVLFLTYKTADLYSFSKTRIDSYIDNLISVIIHEMVHIVQQDKQTKAGRSTPEYRSYLHKNKNEFHDVVRKLSAGKSSDADYKLYRGSPQEIAAFAQEAALKFINDIDIDNYEDIPYLRQSLPNELRMYIDSMFNNPSNRDEHIVFKRFHKLMYQEVDRYIDEVEKKKRKQARSTRPR